MHAEPLLELLRGLFNVPQVLPVGRAALGIAAALQAWRGGGDLAVALPAAVCQDVVVAVRLAGCTPVFCDVDAATGLTSPAQWRQARDAGARAAIVVHLYGNPAHTAAARAAFPPPECLLIDDAAQALGVRTETGLAGTEGDVGVLSFGPTKHIAVGGGALLLRDGALATACADTVRTMAARSDAQNAADAQQAFRRGLQTARTRWVDHGDVRGFDGLLDRLGPTLAIDWNPRWGPAIVHAFANYASRIEARRAKADCWTRAIDGTPLRPVGMQLQGASACIPWRYACRLPGIDAAEQHAIGNALRGRGLDVSHWYLPTHWMLGAPAGSLPGVERLAQEVFQFWLAEATSIEAIVQARSTLRAGLASAGVQRGEVAA